MEKVYFFTYAITPLFLVSRHYMMVMDRSKTRFRVDPRRHVWFSTKMQWFDMNHYKTISVAFNSYYNLDMFALLCKIDWKPLIIIVSSSSLLIIYHIFAYLPLPSYCLTASNSPLNVVCVVIHRDHRSLVHLSNKSSYIAIAEHDDIYI